MSTHALLYIHGFNSSPRSDKARAVLRYMQQHHPEITICMPQLPGHPEAAAEILLAEISAHQGKSFGLIGSSMGGFFSSWLLEHHLPDARAVLLNPAVRPFELMQAFLGEQQNPYTGERYTLDNTHITQLRELDTPHISAADRHWVLVQQGDEVLDPRQAQEKYARCRLTVEPGGDHSFVGFERHLPDIADYLFSR